MVILGNFVNSVRMYIHIFPIIPFILDEIFNGDTQIERYSILRQIQRLTFMIFSSMTKVPIRQGRLSELFRLHAFFPLNEN